jgi:phosphate starvation-inducible PhoH-like protein
MKLLFISTTMITAFSKRVNNPTNSNLISGGGLSKHLMPRTKNQVSYNNLLNNENIKIIFSIGPAGTGKTMFACNSAIQQLNKGKINKIVLTRPLISVEEEIGFLPGDINKKMDPWLKPIMDIFSEYYTKTQLNTMIQNNVIEFSPLGYMRGRTFNDAYVIADEMQNCSPNQMIMLLTRIGFNSKMVITGDLEQSDIKFTSGLSDYVHKIKSYLPKEGHKEEMTKIVLIEMQQTDIQRNTIIPTLLDIYTSNPNPISNPTPNPTPIGKADAALIPMSHITKNYKSYMSD